MKQNKSSREAQADRSETDQISQVLRQIADPALGVNIVDLGLVYQVELQDDRLHASMTMTSPACPTSEMLTSLAEAAIIQQIPTARSVEIELVRDPPWRPKMMSEAAKSQLGWKNP